MRSIFDRHLNALVSNLKIASIGICTLGSLIRRFQADRFTVYRRIFRTEMLVIIPVPCDTCHSRAVFRLDKRCIFAVKIETDIVGVQSGHKIIIIIFIRSARDFMDAARDFDNAASPWSVI